VSRRQSRSADVSDLAELESRLGHKFSNAELARQALTHRSFGTPHNERLEFLGDALLNCAIATLLYERFTHLPEGDLSRLRAALVNQASLSQVAEGLGLGDRLRLGEGELKSGGFRRPSILADALEALFGAVFLDGGYDAARTAMLAAFGERLDRLDPEQPGKDAKTELQEVLQAAHRPLPLYRVVSVEGAAHRQSFQVECVVQDLVAKGTGSSRQKAEQGAARAMLEKLSA